MFKTINVLLTSGRNFFVQSLDHVKIVRRLKGGGDDDGPTAN